MQYCKRWLIHPAYWFNCHPLALCNLWTQATEVTVGYDGCMMAGQRGVPLASNEARQQFLWDVSVCSHLGRLHTWRAHTHQAHAGLSRGLARPGPAAVGGGRGEVGGLARPGPAAVGGGEGRLARPKPCAVGGGAYLTVRGGGGGLAWQ